MPLSLFTAAAAAASPPPASSLFILLFEKEESADTLLSKFKRVQRIKQKKNEEENMDNFILRNLSLC